ncbi:hypothetical protein [Cupriavidus sp. TMH.W2]|uniref:hypothetical protein n=1 Tax=Cupriavidus sp. TMH.W2 TaxID=3434465 RepID=UPI003D779CF0
MAAVAAVAVLTAPCAHAEGILAWIQQISTLNSAYRTVTKQVDAAAEKKNRLRMQAVQALGSAMLDLYNAEQVRKAVNDFGPQGQLVDPCYQLAMASTTHETSVKTGTTAQSAMQRIYTTSDAGRTNAGGLSGMVGNTVKTTAFPYAAMVADRNARHLSRYCTVSEASAGYCTLNANGMQGADVDYSVHMTAGKTYGWDQTEAATDFVKVVAPVKPMPRPGACNDVQCQSALAARRKEEAYLSMARFAFLRQVESHTTQLAGEARKPATSQ